MNHTGSINSPLWAFVSVLVKWDTNTCLNWGVNEILNIGYSESARRLWHLKHPSGDGDKELGLYVFGFLLMSCFFCLMASVYFLIFFFSLLYQPTLTFFCMSWIQTYWEMISLFHIFLLGSILQCPKLQSTSRYINWFMQCPLIWSNLVGLSWWGSVISFLSQAIWGRTDMY